MANSILTKLQTASGSSKEGRPLDKLIAFSAALLVGIFLFAICFSSLSGTYRTIGEKAAAAVMRQSMMVIVEKGADPSAVSAYLKKMRGLYPEVRSIRLYNGTAVVSGKGKAGLKEGAFLKDLNGFHKNGNIELFSVAGDRGYMIPVSEMGGSFWTMAVVMDGTSGIGRAVPFLVVSLIVAAAALILMVFMFLRKDMRYVRKVGRYFILVSMALFFLASHLLLLIVDGDWTGRASGAADLSVRFMLDRAILDGKAAIAVSEQGIPAARKAYGQAMSRFSDQLDDALADIKSAKQDMDIARRDKNATLLADATKRLSDAEGKKMQAESAINPARDQLKTLKATVSGYVMPMLKGKTGGLFKAGFNRMMDGNDVPRFMLAYGEKGTFSIVQNEAVDGLRSGLSFVLLLLASFFIIQFGFGASVIVEQKYEGVKTFFYYFFLEAFVLVCMLPVIWILVASFFSETGIKSIISTIKDSEIFIKNFISLDNYTRNLEGMFLVYFRNSLVVSGVTALFCGTLGIMAGYAFSRFEFPGRKKQMMWILVSQLFPMAMMIVPLYIVSQVLGINKGLFVIVIAYSATSLPFSIWMMKGYFDTVPISLEEAASIDGASTLRRMWHVLLPLSRPAIATTIFYSFITSWNEFAIASFFLNTADLRTLPVALNAMLDPFNPQYALFSAAGVLASLPVVLLFIYLQKHLVSGLMAGGVKG